MILCRTSIFLNSSDLEPWIILELFLSTKGVTWPANQVYIFQSLLMFYYIITLVSIT